jgi:hypothetical protein
LHGAGIRAGRDGLAFGIETLALALRRTFAAAATTTPSAVTAAIAFIAPTFTATGTATPAIFPAFSATLATGFIAASSITAAATFMFLVLAGFCRRFGLRCRCGSQQLSDPAKEAFFGRG